MITFNEWLLKKGKSENTIRTYVKAVSYFEDWYMSTYKVEISYVDIRPVDLRNWKNYLINTARKKNGEPLAVRTVNNYIESVKAFFRYLVDLNIIVDNPSDNIKPQNIKVVLEPRWLDKHEKNLVLRFIEDPILKNRNYWLYIRNQTIVYLSLHAGLRISEIVNLTIYDLKSGFIQIRAAKGQAAREVPMNKSLSRVMNEWLNVRSTKQTESEALLISQKGGHLTTSGIYNFYNKVSKETKIPNLSPHMLRHTFANDLINAGNPITYVAALLGHSDLDTTRIYTTPKRTNLKDAVESLSNE